MSKRRPDVQLTKDNYDRESDEEEVEVLNQPLKLATKEVLDKRVLVKAKRRMGDSGDGNGNSSTLFSGFKSNSTFSGINFGAGAAAAAFNSTANSSASAPSSASFAIPSSFPIASKPTLPTTTIVQSKSDNSESDSNGHPDPESSLTGVKGQPKEDDEFKAKVAKLNEIFYDHIKKYMDTSGLFDFTIVCTEYISKYKEIKDQSAKNEAPTLQKEDTTTQVKSDGLFKFGQKTSDTSSTFKLPQSTFSFGQNTSFGGGQAKTPAFSFGSGNPNLFSNNLATSTPLPSKFNLPATSNSTAASSENNSEAGEGEQEDKPPKVASVEHCESDSVYTKKCKLYYQKEGSFVDKGVGFLYIKTKDDSKPQLLIRSDTTTGNILLNIALVDSLPVQKAKGKGVMLTCIPNPEVEPSKKSDQANGVKQTVTFLIRVNAAYCDELYDTIVKYKSQD